MSFIRKRTVLIILSAALVFSVNFPMSANAEKDQKEATVLEEYEKDSADTKTEVKTEDKEAEKPETELTSANSLGFFDFFRMIAGFAFVIALLYFILRFINKKSKAYQKGSSIKNLGGTNLGNNKSIQLVKIGGKVYIVGVGENVQLLGEVSDEGDIQEILDGYNAEVELMLKPADLFSKIYQNSKKGKDSSPSSSFSEQLKKQLSEMKKNREQLQQEVKKKGNPDE